MGQRRILYQTALDNAAETMEDKNPSSKVKDFDFGEIHSGTFSIKVKGDTDNVLYEKKDEPFEYEKVVGLSNLLKHAGAKLEETQIEFLNEALKGSEETGKAVQTLITIYNNKLKADAKSSAYQSLVNKYTPLEGEKKESAQARTIANMIKLGGVSKEVAIESLKSIGALPADYTVADFDGTPLRRTKGENDSD